MLHFPEKSVEKPSDLQNFGLRIDIYARKHPKVKICFTCTHGDVQIKSTIIAGPVGFVLQYFL